MSKLSFKKILPSKILVMSFIIIIIIGTILLSLPIATNKGQYIDILTAFFTATSAVTVTGLSLVDISTVFSTFGKTIILILIQLGGLGIMSFSTLIFTLIGKRISYHERKILKEDLNSYTLGGIITFLKRIVLIVIIIEIIGTISLTFGFLETMPLKKAIFYAIFHSISAFCNAGFSLFPNSLIGFSNNYIVTITIALLISFGGIGFAVMNSTINYLKKGKARYNLTSKLAIYISIILTLAGTVLFFILEFHNPQTIGKMNIGEAINNSFLQSVTTRTAGFNSINIGAMHFSTVFLFLILMFIGASPGSTGGGIKTTTFGVILFYTIEIIRCEKEVIISNRRIPWQVLNRALAILFISLAYVSTVILLILMTSNLSFESVIFEVISAFGTVGLSLGITSDLNTFGKILIVLTMLIGRVGPITFLLAFGEKLKSKNYKYPNENILIG